MIIYGSRVYGRKNTVKGFGVCSHCGRYCKHESYSGRKWGHLYFIPLIPDGPPSRFIQMCSSCDTGSSIPEDQIPALVADLRKKSELCFAAVFSGAKDFQADGRTYDCVQYLKSMLLDLQCLNDTEYVRIAIAALEQKGQTYAHNMLKAAMCEFNGDIAGAQQAIELAMKADPNDELPFFWLGNMSMYKGNFENAKLCLEKCLMMTDDKLSVLDSLMTVYENLKEWEKLVETYEAAFRLQPSTAGDKALYKGYAKACKKIKKEPAKPESFVSTLTPV